MYELKHNSAGLVSHGVSACAGCGLEAILRSVLAELGEDTVIVIPPGCSALFCGFGRECGIKIAAYQCNLENCAAVCAGIKAGLMAQGNTHTTVLGFAGDGATLDIGIQSLSGAFERRDPILYVCYDNEAYMNTGIQGSSSTPLGAATTTTPYGKPTARKDLMGIAMAHDVPYAAAATVANPADLRRKIARAKASGGPALVHIHCPCPTGWGMDPSKSVEAARKAVGSGAWLLYEYEHGKVIPGKPVKPVPLADYLSMQKRFRGITQAEIDAMEASINAHRRSLEKQAQSEEVS